MQTFESRNLAAVSTGKNQADLSTRINVILAGKYPAILLSIVPLDLEVDRLHRRCYLWLVVFIHPRLKRVRANRILRTQTVAERHGLFRCQRIEVENRLGRCERELLQPSAACPCALLLECLQVFCQQIESGRNSEIHHYLL